MAKFHVNPATGGISRCRAENQCPFGGASGKENHFESIAEAKVSYEKSMKASEISTHSKQSDFATHSTGEAETADSPQLAAAKQALAKATSKWRALDKRLKAADNPDSNFRYTKAWYDMVQKRKHAYYDMRLAYEKRHKELPLEEQKRREEEDRIAKEKDAERFEAWKARKDAENGPYNFHPPIEGKEEASAQQVLMSFGGLSRQEIEAKVAAAEATGLTKTEAYRQVWEKTPLRADKPLVMIDLETAAPMIRNRVDTGPYSSIIEVGYVKRWPDGRIEEKSYLCGVPDNLLATEGTGAEHIHNISPEMVKGLTPFTENEEQQRELLNTLKGSVLVAHNASYETSEFSHNLPGFNSALDRGQVEVLDTRDVVKYFMPETETNNNQAFVEGTGDEYVSAHRALDDAKMTFRALLKHKGMQP